MTYHESIIPIVASVLGSAALILSIYVFKKTLDYQAYRELDSNYMEIIKESMKYPCLRNPDKTKNYKTRFTSEDRLRYEMYAHMVWGICETVYDRRKVDNTWKAAIIAEKELHLEWLKDDKNRKMFKQEFIDFIMKDPIPYRTGWLVK